MSSTEPALRTVIDPALRIGSVSLGVSDVGRSADFYERVLGLPLTAREDGAAALGPDRERPALRLTGIEHPRAAAGPHTGLFHVAWLLPSRQALAESVRRVVAGGSRFDGASDHGVSEALYLHDPDGLGIELYADRPRERWERAPEGDGLRMVTLPLDLEDLLAQSTREPAAGVPGGTGVGHVHLKVSDVERALGFYRDALGFEEQALLPSAAFLSAGGYHHHVGLNSWESRGAGPAPEDAPGLRAVTFELSDEPALARLESAVAARVGETPPRREGEGRLTVRDPDGQLLAFTHG